jgi:hypothetical protein
VYEKLPKTYLGIEHLALRAQSVALRNKVINLLATLQHTLDRLVQDNLGLVELLLDLHDAVRLLRVLVLLDVVLELWEGERLCRDVVVCDAGVSGARVFGDELVDDFGEKLVGYHLGILGIGDDHAADALCAAVGMEDVLCSRALVVSLYSAQGHSLESRSPFSSTSCLCPAFVRAATSPAKNVIWLLSAGALPPLE